MALEVIQIQAGRMDNFSYLVFCPETGHAAAVDPSLAPQALLQVVQERNLQLDLLVNTHGHHDHTAGNQAVLETAKVPLAGHPLDLPDADRQLNDGDRLAIGRGTLEILHTPGHSPGSITLYTGDALLTGDTLFVTFVGRADLPESDPRALYRSLQRLADFPPETKVYPGHNYGPQAVSTIAYEKQHNPYLNCPDLESFLKLRMG